MNQLLTKKSDVDCIILNMRIFLYKTYCPQCKHEYAVDIKAAVEKEQMTCYACHTKFSPDLNDDEIDKIKRFNEIAIDLERKFGMTQGTLMKSYL